MVSRLILSKATAIRGVGAPRVVSFGARSLATSTDKGMHVTELTDKVSEAHHLTKAESKRIISTIFDSITEACANKKKVSISGFGIFETVHANARKGRNPQTGEPLEIAARERIRFRPSKTFKDAVQPEK